MLHDLQLDRNSTLQLVLSPLLLLLKNMSQEKPYCLIQREIDIMVAWVTY